MARKIDIKARLEVAENDRQARDFLLAGKPGGMPENVGDLPALVLLDIKLPGVSGLELLSWIRGEAFLSELVVVIFTSSREPQDLKQAYALGANSFVVKPSGTEELLESLNIILCYWLELNEMPERFGVDSPKAMDRRQ